jgi:hypothetical protein
MTVLCWWIKPSLTVQKNLARRSAILVVVVYLLMLGNVRAALLDSNGHSLVNVNPDDGYG